MNDIDNFKKIYLEIITEASDDTPERILKKELKSELLIKYLTENENVKKILKDLNLESIDGPTLETVILSLGKKLNDKVINEIKKELEEEELEEPDESENKNNKNSENNETPVEVKINNK